MLLEVGCWGDMCLQERESSLLELAVCSHGHLLLASSLTSSCSAAYNRMHLKKEANVGLRGPELCVGSIFLCGGAPICTVYEESLVTHESRGEIKR